MRFDVRLATDVTGALALALVAPEGAPPEVQHGLDVAAREPALAARIAALRPALERARENRRARLGERALRREDLAPYWSAAGDVAARAIDGAHVLSAILQLPSEVLPMGGSPMDGIVALARRLGGEADAASVRARCEARLAAYRAECAAAEGQARAEALSGPTRFAAVVGWGSVERQAAAWGGVATEIEHCLWAVRAAGGRLVGVIGKAGTGHMDLSAAEVFPLTAEDVRARASRSSVAGEVES